MSRCDLEFENDDELEFPADESLNQPRKSNIL